MTLFKNIKSHLNNFLKIFLWVFFVYFLFSIFLNIYFKNKIISNIYLGETALQGTSIEDAKNNIKNLNQNISNKPFVINIDKNNKIYINNSLDKIVNIDQTKAIQNIENSNQNITLLEYPLQIFKNLFLQKNITNEILQINKDKINKILTENIKNTNLAKQEYNIIYLNDNFYISDKRDGIKIKQENFANKFFTEENFQENSEVNIYPDREIDIAERKKEEVAPFILIAQELKTKIKPITLSYFSNLRNVNKNYILENEDILKSLSVKERGGNLYLGIDESSLLKNLELMKNEIYIAPVNPFIKISEKDPKKVEALITPKDGTMLNNEKLVSDLEENLGNKTFVKIETKKIIAEKANDKYGINELLGTGWSSFANSDPARLHNIYNAISKINFLLIEPGENFSLGDSLAPFTNKNGYVDGLVIKGKKIIPETGGGMCQLGTTMFRSAMNSGMPITERRNHSLWLKYYNDPKNGNPGTDATIYSGSPDLKFKNDTGKYIMIKAYATKKDELIIELWGTNDGRIGNYTPPKIVNIIQPPKEMETNLVRELKPGEMICNGPFKGASTVFTYNRTLPNGEKKSEQFWSYYKAEPLRCQIGPDVGYFE